MTGLYDVIVFPCSSTHTHTRGHHTHTHQGSSHTHTRGHHTHTPGVITHQGSSHTHTHQGSSHTHTHTHHIHTQTSHLSKTTHPAVEYIACTLHTCSWPYYARHPKSIGLSLLW